MSNIARPVLVAVGDLSLVAVVRQALASMSLRNGLMVLSQPAELQQYLQDALETERSPAAIVLNMQDAAAIALVAWMRLQRNAIADIPIVAVGAAQSALYVDRINSSLGSPTTEFLANALHLALQDDHGHSD